MPSFVLLIKNKGSSYVLFPILDPAQPYASISQKAVHDLIGRLENSYTGIYILRGSVIYRMMHTCLIDVSVLFPVPT